MCQFLVITTIHRETRAYHLFIHHWCFNNYSRSRTILKPFKKRGQPSLFTPVHRCMGIQPSTLCVVGSYPPETVQPYPFELPTIVCHTARPYLFPFHHILRDSFGIPSGWFGKKVGRLLGGCWEVVGRMMGGWWEDVGMRMGGILRYF